MAKFTKKAIQSSFIKLLNEKPLNQITIRDIVEDCEVNRNTFYYYFQDLPQLVETIVEEDAQRIIQAYPTVGSIEECLDAMIHFALENRTAVMHIYHSANRNLYEQYLWRVCSSVVKTYLDGVLAGRMVSDADRLLLADYLKCVCFGLVMGWLNTGMKADLQSRFHRICVLKQGELEEMIAQCERMPDGGPSHLQHGDTP